MLLKKPYALLIRHFKMLHILLAILIVYSIIKLNNLLTFFNNYLNVQNSAVGQNIRDNLYTNLMFIVPIVILVISLSLLILMIRKKKPFGFYLFNSIVYIVVLIMYIYIFTYLGRMERQVVDIIGVRALRDVIIICISIQSASLIISFVRATGFDIKKFEFLSDLQQLEVSEEDLEEYELDFTFDSNERKRRRNRKLRYLKYEYKENKLFINLILVGIVFFVFYFLYGKLTMYSRVNNEGTMISSQGYIFSVEESYLTNTGYNGINLTDNYLVVIKLKIKCSGKKKELLMSDYALQIGNNRYLSTTKYNESLIDLGETYSNQIITNDYNNYLIVFEIPKEKINDKMQLLFLTKKENYRVKLNPKKEITREENLDLNETIQLDDNTFIQINNYDIQEQFELYYDFCIKDNCYPSTQILTPKLDTNYDKAILKLDMLVDRKSESFYNNFSDIFASIGQISYVKDGIMKRSSMISITNLKKVDGNVFYYEIDHDILNSDHIVINIYTRKCKYYYTLR